MSAQLSFVLLDVTGGATTSNGEKLTPALLGEMAAILNVYANRDVCGEYGGSVVVRAGAGPTDVAKGEIPFQIGATLADRAEFVAVHDWGEAGNLSEPQQAIFDLFKFRWVSKLGPRTAVFSNFRQFSLAGGVRSTRLEPALP